MDKVIPILPCPDVREQASFYEALGFAVEGLYTAPNPYLALRRGGIELHFYGSRKMSPDENPSMCAVRVQDVDAVYASFIEGLKAKTGRVPRSGRPRISKVRDLKEDRRFTLTDPGGNTLYFNTPSTDTFFRSLDSAGHQKDFATLYDLQYSKEAPEIAANMLPRLLAVKDALHKLDRAKLLLLALDIQRDLGHPMDDSELLALMAQGKGADWERVQKRYLRNMGER